MIETGKDIVVTARVAGAFVADQPGDDFARDAYFAQCQQIQRHGGTPVVFQSYGLTEQGDAELIGSYEQIGRKIGQFIAFELGPMFAPFGKIYSLETYRALLGIKGCVGAKHSSLRASCERRPGDF